MKRNVTILLLGLCVMAGSMSARPVRADLDDVKTIDIAASRFQFEPETMTVTQGERVRLRLYSRDRTHAFAIKAFRVKTMIPKAGEAVTVEFVADKAGRFDFTCVEYCGAGHGRMKGTLVVVAGGH